MRMKKRVEREIKFQATKLIAQFLYFTGLTALIPLLPLVLSPQHLIEARYAFGFAVGLIFVGFWLVYWFSHSRAAAYRALGMTTLLPGLLAVFFSYAGPRRQAAVLRLFGEATPFLENWLKTHVPTTWLLAGIYIIIGVGLTWTSFQVRR